MKQGERGRAMSRRMLLAGSASTLLPAALQAQGRGTGSGSQATRETLDGAVDAFLSGWRTGEWKAFIDMLADDCVFQFPSGPHRGRHSGVQGRRHLEQWASEHREAGNRITQSTIDLRLYDGDWIALCDRGAGRIGARAYEGLHAIFMKAHRGKIVEYREYFGLLEA